MMNSACYSLRFILGGTFDPVHFGHLRLGQEIVNHFPDSLISMMPSAVPPHKQGTGASSQQRLEMLSIALESVDYLHIDEREIRQQEQSPEQLSYSKLSLQAMHNDKTISAETALVFVMGTDAFTQFDSWYEWQDILSLCHILVVGRPNSALPKAGVIADYFAKHQCELEEFRRCKQGKIGYLEIPQLDISSTRIRQQISSGISPRFLLPSAIMSYIEDHGLYRPHLESK